MTWEFVDRRACGFGDLDQTGQLKLPSIVRFVMDGYGRAHQEGHGRSRADYFAATGLQPITTHAEVERQPHHLQLDEQLELRFASRPGFYPGRGDDPPRYGGEDRIQLVDERGRSVADWRQHWLWHRLRTGALLHEPPPETEAGRGHRLPAPPPRPRRSERPGNRPHRASPFEQRFHWTLRETDLNQHINVTGFLERAENVLADARRDGSTSISSVDMWFRRPAFVDDEMVAIVDEAYPVIIELRRAATDDLCATLVFRLREVPAGSHA